MKAVHALAVVVAGMQRRELGPDPIGPGWKTCPTDRVSAEMRQGSAFSVLEKAEILELTSHPNVPNPRQKVGQTQDP